MAVSDLFQKPELGIYRSDDYGFVGIRHKMGHRYLFTEYHWDIGPPFGTANPLEAICLCPLKCLEEKIVPLGNQPFQDNTRLFDWIEQKAAELQITPESC